MRALLALALAAAAFPAFADDAKPSADTADTDSSNPGLRHRYDPGLQVGLLTDVRTYEGLDGAATSAGAAVGYAFDLVSVEAQVLQSVATVGERKPLFLKANFDYAFATIGGFSVLGTTGVDYVIHGPDRQTTQVAGDLFGPELGLGARYRVMPLFDIVAYASMGLWAARNGPQRMYVEPGAFGGIQFHPFASE